MPLIGLAVLAAFGGFMNTPFFHGLGNFLHPVFEGVSEQHAPEGSLEYILIGVSVAVAVAGAAVAWMFYRGDADALTSERIVRDPRFIDLLTIDTDGHSKFGAVGELAEVGALECQFMTGEARGLPFFEKEGVLADVGITRRERDRDEHHTEMHDHPAVGPAHHAPPTLAASGEHDLAKRGAAGEPAETEGEGGRPTPRADQHPRTAAR